MEKLFYIEYNNRVTVVNALLTGKMMHSNEMMAHLNYKSKMMEIYVFITDRVIAFGQVIHGNKHQIHLII